MEAIRVAVLGAGGLGRAACRIIGMKRQLRLVAICDSKGYAFDPDGLDCARLAESSGDLVERDCVAEPATAAVTSTGAIGAEAVGALRGQAVARHSDDPLGAVASLAGEYDAVLVTLPNMPNEFIPGVIERFVQRASGLVFVDVLKRTAAVEQLFTLDHRVKDAESVVLTGCGATPGLLTAAAVLAAQSFIEVERVDIWWGVGIANWEAHKATIREDIAHVPGSSVERAKAMTDEEVEAFLERANGLLELHQMEHADDVLLQRVGVVQSLEQVEVGGVMDTRHARKPVSTTMTLTGITFEGKRASHRFILGDETTMAANVIGPALGYLARGVWLKRQKIFGVFGSTEFLPMVVR
ncbi:MAG: saccharopine dehydrogenase-like oxidoreductase [Candidatus Omnitrophica bacterium]|nr:saccharopine dehydrogenase-like oxidoreductase [Candidatus Omnitrophota bacterium]